HPRLLRLLSAQLLAVSSHSEFAFRRPPTHRLPAPVLFCIFLQPVESEGFHLSQDPAACERSSSTPPVPRIGMQRLRKCTNPLASLAPRTPASARTCSSEIQSTCRRE